MTRPSAPQASEPLPLARRVGRAVNDAWNPYQPGRLPDTGLEPVEMEESRIRRSAVWALLAAMLAFALWATLAPIDGGVTVPGTVVVQGYRKAVQHPKGGVVQAILVKEGDRVAQGDVLVRMNPLNTEAELTSVELQYINLLATESRLVSERRGLAVIEWAPELQRRAGDARAVEAKALQTQLFRTRQEDLRGQQLILREQIAGLRGQLRGLSGLLNARTSQLHSLREDDAKHRALAAQGFLPRIRANETARQVSEVAGEIAETNADLAKTRADIARAELQLLQLGTGRFKEIDGELSQAQKTREALQSKVASLQFERSLTDLRAPAGGTVVGVKTHTVGGVIQPADVLMEIVPAEEGLIVEARVPPALIDKVRTGLEADLRFTAFNRATTPVLPGRVRLVGADRIKPQSDQEEYYLSLVELTPEGRAQLGPLAVQAGMPVDVIVKTGERNFVSYFVKPITDRLAKAMKED
jgi:protease secretion system membrane fusion protein